MIFLQRAVIRLRNLKVKQPIRPKLSPGLLRFFQTIVSDIQFCPSIGYFDENRTIFDMSKALALELEWCRAVKIFSSGPVGWSRNSRHPDFDFLGLRLDAVKRRRAEFGLFASRHELEHEIQFLLSNVPLEEDWTLVWRCELYANRAAAESVTNKFGGIMLLIRYNLPWLIIVSFLTAVPGSIRNALFLFAFTAYLLLLFWLQNMLGISLFWPSEFVWFLVLIVALSR